MRGGVFMAYASTSDVAALCPQLLGGEANFSPSTSPTDAEVEAWLSAGCGILEAHLESWGYDPPPGSSTAVWSFLGHLNALYAAAQAELSRMNVSLSPEERTRAEFLEDRFWQDLNRLRSLDLSAMGLSKGADRVLYTGGISQTEKDSWDEDPDRVPPRFRRGQFAFPGTIRAWTTSAS